MDGHYQYFMMRSKSLWHINCFGFEAFLRYKIWHGDYTFVLNSAHVLIQCFNFIHLLQNKKIKQVFSELMNEINSHASTMKERWIFGNINIVTHYVKCITLKKKFCWTYSELNFTNFKLTSAFWCKKWLWRYKGLNIFGAKNSLQRLLKNSNTKVIHPDCLPPLTSKLCQLTCNMHWTLMSAHWF